MNRYHQLAEMQKRWVAPRELRHSPPRPVRLSWGGVLLATLGIALLLGAFAAAVLLGRASTRQTEGARLLAGQGREMDAAIVRLWRGNGEDKRCHVEYRFDFEGRGYRNQTDVPLAIWKTLKAGGVLPVRFLPSNPELNHPSGWRKRPMSIWLAILAAAGLLGFALLIAAALRRQMDLLAEGRVAPAVVTGLRKVHHSHGGSVTIMRYEFPLMSGGIARGKSSSQRKGIAVGTVLCVIYDPDNTRRSSPYPFDLVRVGE